MFRKLAVATAISAALLIPLGAFAAHNIGGHAAGGHSGGGHNAGHSKGHANSHIAKQSGGHGGSHASSHVAKGKHVRVGSANSHAHGGGPHFNHARRFWHDRWYAYGVGPCWIWSGDYDEYVWQCT